MSKRQQPGFNRRGVAFAITCIDVLGPLAASDSEPSIFARYVQQMPLSLTPMRARPQELETAPTQYIIDRYM